MRPRTHAERQNSGGLKLPPEAERRGSGELRWMVWRTYGPKDATGVASRYRRLFEHAAHAAVRIGYAGERPARRNIVGNARGRCWIAAAAFEADDRSARIVVPASGAADRDQTRCRIRMNEREAVGTPLNDQRAEKHHRH